MVEASPWHCRAYISLVAKELEKSPSRSPAMQNESPSLKKAKSAAPSSESVKLSGLVESGCMLRPTEPRLYRSLV